MSDLISTPSQSQSEVSSQAFEALIDLLTSDGGDHHPSGHTGDPAWAQPNTTLRDPSGKLDFDRIRHMFAAQNESHRPQRTEDGDSDDEPHSHRSTSSTIPSRATSMSPKPVENTAANTGHRRSSTFGNQPWAAIHENTAPAKEDVTTAQAPQPLSFDELNVELAGAQEEMRNLRQQYDELRVLVTQRLGIEGWDHGEGGVNVEPGKVGGHVQTRNTGSQAQPSAVAPPVPLPADVPAEIASLSANEAKIALSVLARSLNLSLDTLASLADPAVSNAKTPNQSLSLPTLTRQQDLASLIRAVKFLGSVDELVWRRSSGPSGPRTLLPVFSEENTIALVARLVLWERAVRRSPRI